MPRSPDPAIGADRVDPSEERYMLKRDRYSSHAQIAAWLRAFRARRPDRAECAVLDIGCARGFLGFWLSGPEFYLMGVDNDAGALADIHPNYRQTVQADIESLPALDLDRRPDVMVLADVLEHCRDAAEVLTSLCRGHLAPGAAVVISLPNIAHLHVRLSLLLGRFDYADRGLLDRTHLRFFTFRTAWDLCTRCAIHVEQIAVTPTPLPLIDPGFAEGGPLHALHRVNFWATRVFKRLLGYQFIFFGTYQP